MPPEELTYRDSVKKDLQEIKADQQEIKAMVRYTNGKVRKITISLVLIGGIIIGQTFTSAKDIIELLAHIL